jgi:aspartate/methionine/tyrosine aminotransferase
LDLEAVRQRITPRTRAIALVHPNNPTGHFTKLKERELLEQLCCEHELALIVDEVFLDYPLAQMNGGSSFAVGPHPALTFVLSGMSKIAGLPQMKAAWIAAFGPKPDLESALQRLEVIADTFLSMNAPVQCALPHWLKHRRQIQGQIQKRVAGNLQGLDEILSGQTMVTRLDADAGWYAVLRVPAVRTDEDLAIELIQSKGVSVHPGYFFGFPSDGWLVVSLLTPEEEFHRGIEVILSFCN